MVPSIDWKSRELHLPSQALQLLGFPFPKIIPLTAYLI